VTCDGWVAPGFEAVASAFEACVEPGGPGAALAAVVDGELVVDVWLGTASDDGRAWHRDTGCVVASGSKGVVAVAMLMLIERRLLDLESPVARYWPEFGANGKAGVRVADVVAHAAGVPGVVAPLSPDDLADAQKIHQLLAAQAPIVPVGTVTYHALTYGWLCDALVRRVDGRSIGNFVADEIAGPLGLDLIDRHSTSTSGSSRPAAPSAELRVLGVPRQQRTRPEVELRVSQPAPATPVGRSGAARHRGARRQLRGHRPGDGIAVRLSRPRWEAWRRASP
jgi:CubicO group peptidase (beta-lactamase class C family)